MGLLALVRVGGEGIFGRDQIGENLLDPIEINSFWQASLKLKAIGADYAE